MRFLIVLLTVFCCVLPVRAAEKARAVAHEPNVEIWLPPDFRKSEGPWPLLIFSHGFGGCARQSAFLMSYLAEAGYIVAAPDHADARLCKDMRALERADFKSWPEKPFRQPEQWTDKTESDRRDDILFTLKSLTEDPQYKGYIDEDRIGLIGHSLGGYAVLGLAGAWPSWKDSRFKAVLALAPYSAPYVMKNTLNNIAVPVMYQGGTLDKDTTPLLKKPNGTYMQTPAPKYFIELDRGNHFSWTEREKDHRDIIDRTSLAFFDKYLRGADVLILPDKGARGVKTYWKEETSAAKAR